jgi:hypothetical protein
MYRMIVQVVILYGHETWSVTGRREHVKGI